MKNGSYNVVLVGEVTIDHNSNPAGTYIGSGGSVFFASKIFENLQVNPTVITVYGKDFQKNALPKTRLYPPHPQSEKTLVFENIYNEKGDRTQKVHNRANFRYVRETGPASIQNGDALLIAPLLPSLTKVDLISLLKKFSRSLKILLPQGLMRKVTKKEIIIPTTASDIEGVFDHFDFIILSEKDGQNTEDDYIRWSRKSIVVVTRADKGCSVYRKGKREDYPAFHVDYIVDATGAGDIFAAGFTYAYLKTKNLAKSIYFAHATAGLSLRYLPNQLQYGYSDIISFASQQRRDVSL